MNIFEVQQQVKEKITAPITKLFNLQAEQVFVNFDAEEKRVTITTHISQTITYDFIYHFTANDLQCIMLGATITDNPFTLTVLPMSISLNVLARVRQIILEAFDETPQLQPQEKK